MFYKVENQICSMTEMAHMLALVKTWVSEGQNSAEQLLELVVELLEIAIDGILEDSVGTYDCEFVLLLRFFVEQIKLSFKSKYAL